MALTSNDGLQVGIAVFCMVVSLMTAMMVPILASDYTDGVSYAELYEDRQSLEEFTGESMLSQTPFNLTGVYTPFISGMGADYTTDGWLYGESIADYPYIGEVSNIKLDPNQKSSVLFSQTIVQTEIVENKWYYGDNILGDAWWWLAGGVTEWITGSSSRTEVVQQQINTWDFTGYRYEFQSMVSMYSEGVASDASLSIIWYDVGGSQGISGGLVLYDNMNDAIIANYSATDIIAGYVSSNNYATGYVLDFNGWKVNMYVRFDSEVIDSGIDLADAWDEGLWTVAFSSTSVDGLMNTNESNSLSVSVGSIISTYIDIFTFDVPNIPSLWSTVLWILCFIPMSIVAIMFFIRILDVVVPF